MLRRSSVLCLLFIALVVLIGACPAGSSEGAKSSIPLQVFSSPVFIVLVLWLCGACVACCRGKLRFRQSGFLLTHLGVVTLLIGALWGGLSERKVAVVSSVGEHSLTDRLALSRPQGELKLPFTLSVPGLEPIPEYVFHVPDSETRAGYRMAGRYLPTPLGIDLGEHGMVGMDRLQPDGQSWVGRVVLADGAFLQQNRSAGMSCRANIRLEKEGQPPKEVLLAQGESGEFFGARIQLDGLEWRSETEVLVQLRIQLSGAERWESVYVSPGPEQRSSSLLRSHLALPFSLGVTRFRVDHFDPDYALYLPPTAEAEEYTYVDSYTPGPGGVTIGPDDVVPLSRLRPEGGEWVAQVVLSDQRMLRRLPAGDRYYEARVVIRDTTEEGTTVEEAFTLAVNQPVRYRGWRFYLVSYDRQHGEARYLNLTARRDPGRNVVIAGIWMLMAGTFLLCLMRKEAPHAA